MISLCCGLLCVHAEKYSLGRSQPHLQRRFRRVQKSKRGPCLPHSGAGEAGCHAAGGTLVASRRGRRPVPQPVSEPSACFPARDEVRSELPVCVVFIQSAWNRAVSRLGTAFGHSKGASGKHVIVEHTSSNPNAPLHIGNLRNVMIGDHLARLLSAVGYTVTQAFYVNDLGAQARAREIDHRTLTTRLRSGSPRLHTSAATRCCNLRRKSTNGSGACTLS